MGGGGSGGMTNEQRYYQEQQLKLQKESLEQSKQAVLEPAKSVAANMEGASQAEAQAAALKRGIASTFNRSSAFGPSSGGATGGTTTKLGN